MDFELPTLKELAKASNKLNEVDIDTAVEVQVQIDIEFKNKISIKELAAIMLGMQIMYDRFTKKIESSKEN